MNSQHNATVLDKEDKVAVIVPDVGTNSMIMIYFLHWTTAAPSVKFMDEISLDVVSLQPKHACPGDVYPPHFSHRYGNTFCVQRVILIFYGRTADPADFVSPLSGCPCLCLCLHFRLWNYAEVGISCSFSLPVLFILVFILFPLPIFLVQFTPPCCPCR